VDELWAMGDLKSLLPCVRECVSVYLSKDDPLNDPAEVAALEAHFKPPLFNVLPGGGHLGFAESEWVRKTVKNAFGPRA
jgi:predicted alpha/beta-fold hydrolase